MDTRLMKHGMFSWNELLTEDVAAASRFYTELLGWEAEEQEMDTGPYTLFKVDGEQVAGLMQLPEQAKQMGAPPNWGSYITVDDADAVAAKVEELGGKILVPPTDIPALGRFCTFQDPQGAVISVINYVYDS